MPGSSCLIRQPRLTQGLGIVLSEIYYSHGMRTVTARKSSATRESLAEGTHACLALIAVVLLARAQSGAFDRAPSSGIAIPFSILIWAAAAAATRWNPPSRQPWFTAWRSCVSPTLIALICGGRGSVSLLLGELAVTAAGIAAVGYLSCQSRELAGEPILLPTDAEPPQSAVSSGNDESVAIAPEREPSSTPHLVAAAPAVQATPTPLPPPSSGNKAATEIPSDFVESGNLQRLDPAHDGVALHLGAPQHETVDTLTSEESPDTESWTRREFEGEVSIEAVVFARFAEGSKLAVLHLPFVPPLPEVPQIDHEPLDSGCDVTITTESAFRHGAKLNVTRRSAGPAESIPIGIVIYTSVEEEIES